MYAFLISWSDMINEIQY